MYTCRSTNCVYMYMKHLSTILRYTRFTPACNALQYTSAASFGHQWLFRPYQFGISVHGQVTASQLSLTVAHGYKLAQARTPPSSSNACACVSDPNQRCCLPLSLLADSCCIWSEAIVCCFLRTACFPKSILGNIELRFLNLDLPTCSINMAFLARKAQKTRRSSLVLAKRKVRKSFIHSCVSCNKLLPHAHKGEW